MYSFVGDVVLDPFNGSGTTCVAAKATGRTYVGVDLSDSKCEIPEQRLEATEAWVAPEVQI
jgi:site-specific DNA-methyltransferase (adenine-specific)